MKKTNFTKTRMVKNWLMIVAFLFTSFSVTQLNAQCQLNAEDDVFISVDDNCEAMLTMELFLTDDGVKCPDAGYYTFQVVSLDMNTTYYVEAQNLVVSNDSLDYGVKYIAIVRAYDANDNLLNTAMPRFLIQDKKPPVFTCPTDTIDIKCYDQEVYTPVVADNCTPDNKLNIVKIDDKIWDNDCSNPTVDPLVNRIIDRSFIAIDESGNQSDTCSIVIRVSGLNQFELSNMVRWPKDLVKAHGTAISCKDADSYKDANGDFNPNKTGWPSLVYPDNFPTAFETAHNDLTDTVVLDNNCNFACKVAATYIDVTINTCPTCIEKVLRTWSVTEQTCNYPWLFTFPNFQTIEVVDTIPPVIVCPDNETITTNTIGNFDPTSAGALDCGARYTFPKPTITDECSNYTVWTIAVMNDLGHPVMFADTNETKHTVSRDLPLGVNTVTYTAYDNCGNKASCEWTVTVEDNTPPVAVCQQFTTVSLTYDGEAQIFAPSFDSGSYDDCSIDSFGVRRMDNKIDCEGHVDTDVNNFFDYVTFCCDDIADDPITVIMRVWDKGGRHNDCMVQVTVQDKLPPQITCPPSICVECTYPFVLDKAGLAEAFGTVVQGYDNREVHTISGNYGSQYRYDIFSDTWDCDKPETNFKFKDGWSRDNCNLEMDDSYVDNRTQCNEGNIVRTFKVSDPNGYAECTQTIHFFNPHPFDKYDIRWPADYPVEGCYNEAAYGPDITGWPKLNEDACDLVAANYKDDVFHFNDDKFDVEGVCFKVIRHWTVMDWCQKYPDNYPNPALAGKFYTWHYDQVIMVSEYTPPAFTTTCEDKETCTYDSECESGYIELSMSAHDDCTTDENLKWRYRIYDDDNNDGSFDKLIVDSKDFTFPHNIISGATASASGTYPIGKHRIVWTVWDQCGNKAVCDKFFTIKNCKKPTPRCIDHIVIEMMPLDAGTDGIADWAMIEVGAQLVEVCCAKSSHPCGYPLKYSFSADTSDTKRTYYCGNDGADPSWYSVDPAVGHLEPIEMWVTALLPDGTITQDNCVTNIDFQDNNHACDAPDGLVSVSGMVTTTQDEPINKVKIELQGSEEAPQNTGDNGTFEFDVNSNKNYNLALSKDGDDLSGITTLDIVLIQKHLLGIKKFDNPYKMIAANVNDDEKVTASDILKIRKLILGSIDDIGESWLFLPKDYTFANPSHPFTTELPKAVKINPTDDMFVNFYGIKLGDVNMSLNVLEARSSEELVLTVDDINVQAGQVEVPVYANDFNNVEGFQYTVDFDASAMQFEGIESGLIEINNSNIGTTRVTNGKLTMSWDKNSEIISGADEPLFTLKFNTIKNANLSDIMSINSSVTKKEAYNSNLEVMDVKLQYRSSNVNTFELYQNTPNPFSTITDISFNLPESSTGTISIYDLSGKVLKVISKDFEKGMNTVRIKKSDLNVSGVLYYRLETGDYTATKKMILIK